jgi:ribosomal protein S18 acetylase RimI-like enzyme
MAVPESARDLTRKRNSTHTWETADLAANDPDLFPMIPLVARSATAEDYPQFESLFGDLGLRGDVPSAAVFARDVAPHAIMLEEVAAGAVVAYGHFVVEGGVGRVLHVAVDHEWRRRGVGRALMTEIATRLRAQGCARWALAVAPENVPAIRLFETVGLRVVAADSAGGGTRMEGDLGA